MGSGFSAAVVSVLVIALAVAGAPSLLAYEANPAFRLLEPIDAATDVPFNNVVLRWQTPPGTKASPAYAVYLGRDPFADAAPPHRLQEFALNEARLAYADLDGSGAPSPGDGLWITPQEVARGSFLPSTALRLSSPVGAMGTRLTIQEQWNRDTLAHASTETIPATPNRIKQVEYGVRDDVRDNCFYFGPVPGPVQEGDLRLNGCNGNWGGSIVGASDFPEVGANPLPSSGFANLLYEEWNPNGRFDFDLLFFSSGDEANLTATRDSKNWTLAASYAGPSTDPSASFIFADSPNFPANQSRIHVIPPGLGLVAWDKDGSGKIGPGDAYYLARKPIHRGDGIPAGSHRLFVGQQPWVNVGDVDHAPHAHADAVALNRTTVKAFSRPGAPISETCLVFSPREGALQEGDLNLNDCPDGQAGFRVTEHSAEYLPAPRDAHANAVVFVDVDGDGRTGPTEGIYLTTGGAGDLAVSVDHQHWSLRLRTFGAHQAGSFVRAGEVDSAPDSSIVRNLPTGTGVVWDDGDGDGTFLEDPLYLAIQPMNAGSGFPLGILRLAPYEFGVPVKLGDREFVPRVAGHPPLRVCRGNATSLETPAYYLTFTTATVLQAGAFRLGNSQAGPPGTWVNPGDADVSDLLTCFSGIGFVWIDANESGGFDATDCAGTFCVDDYLYLSTNPSAIVATSNATSAEWSLRLGNVRDHPPGTLVDAAAQDVVATDQGITRFTSWAPAASLEKETEYFWRVQLPPGYGDAGISPTWKFTTSAEPASTEEVAAPDTRERTTAGPRTTMDRIPAPAPALLLVAIGFTTSLLGRSKRT